MSKIIEIGIAENSNMKIIKKENINVVAAKGIVGDRYYREYNSDNEQITLIEKENIDYYNLAFGTNYKYLDFRRNLITQDISLNNLVGKILMVGNIKIKVNDLCRPCRDLQNKLGQENIIKEFLRRGGIRCEILSSGSIKVGDKIKTI